MTSPPQESPRIYMFAQISNFSIKKKSKFPDYRLPRSFFLALRENRSEEEKTFVTSNEICRMLNIG